MNHYSLGGGGYPDLIAFIPKEKGIIADYLASINVSFFSSWTMRAKIIIKLNLSSSVDQFVCKIPKKYVQSDNRKTFQTQQELEKIQGPRGSLRIYIQLQRNGGGG